MTRRDVGSGRGYHTHPLEGGFVLWSGTREDSGGLETVGGLSSAIVINTAVSPFLSKLYVPSRGWLVGGSSSLFCAPDTSSFSSAIRRFLVRAVVFFVLLGLCCTACLQGLPPTMYFWSRPYVVRRIPMELTKFFFSEQNISCVSFCLCFGLGEGV